MSGKSKKGPRKTVGYVKRSGKIYTEEVPLSSRDVLRQGMYRARVDPSRQQQLIRDMRQTRQTMLLATSLVIMLMIIVGFLTLSLFR
jgi:hypothetical protein